MSNSKDVSTSSIVGYDKLDEPRERFFGWVPYIKKQRIMLLLCLAVLFFAFGIVPYLPTFWLFGWIPSLWIYVILSVLINTVIWTIYFKKYWTAYDDDKVEKMKGEN